MASIFRSAALIAIIFNGACGLFRQEAQKEKLSPGILNRVVRPILNPESAYTDSQATQAAESVNSIYYWLLAQNLSAKRNSADALVALDRVQKLDPGNARVQLALAQEYINKGLVTEGIAAVRKAHELDPKDRDAKLMLANLFATAKKYSEAMALFSDLEQESPDDEEVMLYMALIEIEQKELTRAQRRLERFLDKNAEAPLAWFYLGRLQQERGNRSQALKAYLRSLEIRPGFVQAGTYLAFLYEDMQRPDLARQTYEWLAVETDDVAFYKKIGQIHLDANNFKAALSAFESVDRIEPGEPNNLLRMGLLQLELKDYKQSAVAFERLLKKAPEQDNVHYYLGAVYEQQERFSDALDAYQKVPITHNLYTESVRRRATILGKIKKVDQGWELLQSVAQNASKENTAPDSWTEISTLYLETFKTPDAAKEFLDLELAKNPKSEQLLYLKGSLQERMGDSKSALATMQLVLKSNPDHAGALNFVGYLWADRGERLSEAETLIRKALKIRPGDPFITDSLAWVYFRKGRLKDAHDLLVKAFSARPDEAEIADHLADVLVKLGRFDEAKKYYDLALELQPTKESFKKKIEGKRQRVEALLTGACSPCNSQFVLDETPAARSPARQ